MRTVEVFGKACTSILATTKSILLFLYLVQAKVPRTVKSMLSKVAGTQSFLPVRKLENEVDEACHLSCAKSPRWMPSGCAAVAFASVKRIIGSPFACSPQTHSNLGQKARKHSSFDVAKGPCHCKTQQVQHTPKTPPPIVLLMLPIHHFVITCTTCLIE